MEHGGGQAWAGNGQPWAEAPAGRRAREGRWTWALALAATLAFLAAALVLAWHWDQRQVHQQHDVLFDTDTKSRLGCYANGWAGHGRNTVHPNLCNFVNPPIRALAQLSPPEQRLAQRERLALWVSPLAGALTLGLLLLALRRGGVGLGQSLLLGGVLAASFSQLLFSSVPDHFALGGLTLALALWLFSDSLAGGPPRRAAWLAVAWLAAGITLTNLIPVAGLHLLALWRRAGATRALRDTVVLGLVAVLGTYASALVLNLGYGLHGYEILLPKDGAGPIKTDPAGTLLGFPLRVLQSFAPAGYEVVANPLSLREPHHYAVQFDLARQILPSAAGWLLGGLVLACAVLRWRQGGTQPVLLLGLAGVVLFNGLLHARIGSDYFLYSSHWMAATVMLLALPGQEGPAWGRRLHAGLLGLLVLALAANSIQLLRALDADLLRHWRPMTEQPAAEAAAQEPSP